MCGACLCCNVSTDVSKGHELRIRAIRVLRASRPQTNQESVHRHTRGHIQTLPVTLPFYHKRTNVRYLSKEEVLLHTNLDIILAQRLQSKEKVKIQDPSVSWRTTPVVHSIPGMGDGRWEVGQKNGGDGTDKRITFIKNGSHLGPRRSHDVQLAQSQLRKLFYLWTM